MVLDEVRRGGATIERVLGLILLAALIAACLQIVAPFIVPLLWGIILSVSTWPIFARLRDLLGGRRRLAATLMTLVLLALFVGPIAFLVASMADNVQAVAGLVRDLGEIGANAPPAWLDGIPWIGPLAARYWTQLAANMSSILASLQPAAAVVTGWLLQRGADVGIGVLEFLVAVLIAGILYVAGEDGVRVLHRFVRRIGGEERVALVDVAGKTISSVAQSVIGTAFAQGIVAAIGFVIAGVPGTALLSLITFMVALVQVPTAIVWVPVTIWLLYQGNLPWGIFMGLWGFFVINTVDNVIRPMMISSGAKLPFLLMFVGVVGGLFAYGFIGIFLGATLLAVSYTLFLDWLGEPDPLGRKR